MFEVNVLLQFSIALFIFCGGWPCDLCQDHSIQDQRQGHKLKAKAGQPKAKNFGLKTKVKA